jgi:hypothetical protein
MPIEAIVDAGTEAPNYVAGERHAGSSDFDIYGRSLRKSPEHGRAKLVWRQEIDRI